MQADSQSEFGFAAEPATAVGEPVPQPGTCPGTLEEELAAFRGFGKDTVAFETRGTLPDGRPVSAPTYVNEFWTAAQRASHRLHEVSYRACFKAQLPRFFIDRLSLPGDRVYDPFMGRGTTPLEAALAGRLPAGNDINPLSRVLLAPRLNPPTIAEVAQRLSEIDFKQEGECPEELLVFYHRETLKEIAALRQHLLERQAGGGLDRVDEWIRMIAVNRLTGHSPGFFSVYTLPPNQATSVKAQTRINERRSQIPPRRDVPAIILKKSKSLLGSVDRATREALDSIQNGILLTTHPADSTPEIPSDSVALAVTSPPFLNIVNYAGDNWLRCWFIGVDPRTVAISTPGKLEKWQAIMTRVMTEVARVLKPGGHFAFEVGEVRGGSVKLEETVLPSGVDGGLEPRLILINDQKFTKTANCWGVDNNSMGTNSNRIVLFRKPA